VANEAFALDKTQLRAVMKSFQGMDEQAQTEAKNQTGQISDFARSRIIDKSQSLNTSRVAASRIAEGSKVKKSSKIGEITFGYVAQKFSGGGDTKQLWGGFEFGSNKFKQFPVWSGKQGRGSRGWFIYPTLREIQPEIVSRWTDAFGRVLKEW
jgi:hypothetical protein